MIKINLPSLNLVRKTGNALITQELRPQMDVAIVNEKVYSEGGVRGTLIYLENGDVLFRSSTKMIDLPEGVTGALQTMSSGLLRWSRHRVLDEVEASIEKYGWDVLRRCVAGQIHGAMRPLTGQSGDDGLRPPQTAAFHALSAHWQMDPLKPATVVMPTGTGKTETMLTVFAAHGAGPTLVVVPGKALAGQTAKKFLTLGKLRELGVIRRESPNPIVGVLRKSVASDEDLEVFRRCNVVVAVINSLTHRAAAAHLSAIAELTQAVYFDEAHHLPAANWDRLKSSFEGKRILQLTATPFRRDGQLVEGKVVFRYSLAQAQADGYFKPIRLIPISAASGEQADRLVAEKAIATLRRDLAGWRTQDNNSQGPFDHRLLARCSTINRATRVFEIYKEFAPDLEPVLIHSDSPNSAASLNALREGTSKIAVCVDMLGEGFDLPQLKVAALHDAHKSLAVFLQFAGRFTRSSNATIGNASAVANVADVSMGNALERLYSEDADWNSLLSELSGTAIERHSTFVEFLDNSQPIRLRDDPLQIVPKLLRPIFATAVYRVTSYSPSQFIDGLERKRRVVAAWRNDAQRVFYFVTRKDEKVRWSQSRDLQDTVWDLFVLHYDESRNFLFISSTEKKSLFESLAKAVSPDAVLVKEDQVFRVLHGISMLTLQNVGLKRYSRRNLSFSMHSGQEVGSAISQIERTNSIRNNLSGVGWEGGRRVAIGCSQKGRIWSPDQGTLPDLLEWFSHIGRKLANEKIDTSQVLNGMLYPEAALEVPDIPMLSIDWPEKLLRISESRVRFSATTGSNEWPLYRVELFCPLFGRSGQNTFDFEIRDGSGQRVSAYQMEVGPHVGGLAIRQTSGIELNIITGGSPRPLTDFFINYPPTIRFVDLCVLEGDVLIRPRPPGQESLPDTNFYAWDWSGTNIEIESIWDGTTSRANSIQRRVADEFIAKGFGVVVDDDGAGEAADLVCLKDEPDRLVLALVHCKYSNRSTPGSRLSDVVEVCSQAVRSAKWKWRFSELIQHVSRRSNLDTPGRDRYLAGDISELKRLSELSRSKPVEARVLIAQPGLRKSARSIEQERILIGAHAYLKETIGCDLEIISST